MPRLFVTNKEIDFFNDITKEVIKDINGQKITYWPISTLKTKIHPVYNEAVKKIFENPISVDALVGQPNWSAVMNQFGAEQTNKLEVFIQARDLEQKGIEISEGDYFVYGTEAYEIVSSLNINNYFGQAEHDVGFKITGILARHGEFDPKNFYRSTDEHVSLTEFQQQRGLPENMEGPTGDIRNVHDRQGQDAIPPALGDGPRKVGVDHTKKTTTFYSDD